jgi:hypothetical protein
VFLAGFTQASAHDPNPSAAPRLTDQDQKKSIDGIQPFDTSDGNILLTTLTRLKTVTKESHPRKALSSTLVSQQLVLHHSWSINNFLPQRKHG